MFCRPGLSPTQTLAKGDAARVRRVVPAPEHAEELSLFERIRAGDRAARDRVILDHAWLVCDVAREFAREGETADLQQEGFLGLMRGVDKFDPSNGAAFRSYAFACIYTRINGSLKTTRRRAKMDRKAGRSWFRSPDACDEDRRDGTGEDDASWPRSDQEWVLRAIEGLPDRERQALRMRFGLDPSGPVGYSEIGMALGVERRMARSICDAGLTRLRRRWTKGDD
jgi:RNA polymerase sigma factor (sigma-70 family)